MEFSERTQKVRQPHPNHDKTMPRKQTPKPPQPAAEAESLAGVASTDLFAFVGVRRIIGDPLGRLMQDEVADRIQKLVNVLRETVGIMDALKLIDTLPGMTAPERKAVAMCRDQIREMLDEQMPEWDDVCKAVYEANAKGDSQSPDQKS